MSNELCKLSPDEQSQQNCDKINVNKSQMVRTHFNATVKDKRDEDTFQYSSLQE